MENKKKKYKLSIQKIFNIISFTFLLACCIFYGGRFIKLYLENNKTEETKVMADFIKDNNINNKNFKNINGDYYFYGASENNYVKYSNLYWRIIKVNNDNTINVVLDNPITSLAYGNNKDFETSYINKWLNKQSKEEYTGILEKNLNNKELYLTFTNTCMDNITDVKNITCKNKTKDLYITTPSLNDLANTGSSKSFLNNNSYYYLINKNNNNEIWYVNEDGKVSTNDGNDIIGIKPVITIKNTVSLISGDGNKDNPYYFEQNDSILGSYVKTGNHIWRIFDEENNIVKLSLDSYLTEDNVEIKHNYSNKNYYHNDTIKGSLAYYLNNTFLKEINKNDIVLNSKLSNGIYNNQNNFNYIETLEKKVDTKVSLLSIGDIIINSDLTNYYLSTGISEQSNMIYVMQNNFKLTTKNSITNLKIVPVISISKDKLINGQGTKENPYEV